MPAHAARTHFLRSLRSYDEVGSIRGIGQAVLGLAVTEHLAGHTERTVQIAASASLLLAKSGIVVEHAMLPGIGARIAELRASVPEAAIEATVASGQVAASA